MNVVECSRYIALSFKFVNNIVKIAPSVRARVGNRWRKIFIHILARIVVKLVFIIAVKLQAVTDYDTRACSQELHKAK